MHTGGDGFGKKDKLKNMAIQRLEDHGGLLSEDGGKGLVI